MCSASLTSEPSAVNFADPGGLLFPSLLPGGHAQRQAAADTLTDLHLDDVIEAAAPGAFQRSVWKAPLADVRLVVQRQQVAEDVRSPAIRQAADAFAAAMEAARVAIRARADAHYPLLAELNLVEAISRFADAVVGFADALATTGPRSDGLRSVAGALATYARSTDFLTLAQGSAALIAELRTGPVELGLRSGTVWVDDDHGSPPWAERIAAFFARFEEVGPGGGAVPARPRRFPNHVEAQAVGLVAQLRPETFRRVHDLVRAHADFLPDDLARLGDELRFFLGFWTLADRLAAEGTVWCRPRVLPAGGGGWAISGMTDLALALRSRPGAPPLVPNDLALGRDERVAFVTGPNQGGKTTLARAIGQVTYLASLGLPVAARSATLPLLGTVLTHFPRPDDPEHERGGLAEELSRLHPILEQADRSALLVFNELFSSTSAQDALELSGRVLQRIAALECTLVWVTFLDELVSSTGGAVSLVGQVASDDITRPTFRFRRQPPSGRSHAAALAARHGLGAHDLARRLA